jgi:predicted DNA-binding transcriptional regulator YafY
MSQLERIYSIDRMLRRRIPPTRREIVTSLEISTAQFKRDLEFMRDRLGAPVTFDRGTNGYCYSPGDFNLPGMWFSQPELYSMLLMHSLIEQLQPGLVREQIEPFRARLRSLLGAAPGRTSILERIHVTPAPQRHVDTAHFQTICDAALHRKRLRIRYFARYRNAETDRTVSPVRVIYYRGNWYLDAWCHDKAATRRFAIDAIREASVLEEDALEAAPPGVQGYGIFAGAAEAKAVLVFDAEAARWVAEEQWHPAQILTRLPDGGVQLEVPYSLPQEILMDILRHGEHVEVLRPVSLRRAVSDALRQAAERYSAPKPASGADHSNPAIRPVGVSRATRGVFRDNVPSQPARTTRGNSANEATSPVRFKRSHQT